MELRRDCLQIPLEPPISKRAFAGMGLARLSRAYVRMSELFSILPPWFCILLALGLLDALIQWSNYRHSRREHEESEE